jgi:CHAP domain
MLAWEPTPSLYWQANRAAIIRIFDNGDCTQLAAHRRPGVLRRIVETLIARDLRAGVEGEALPSLDARYWGRYAKLAGIATGKQPKPRALMVFQPGVLGAGPAGHIAYVLRVASRSVTIAEMNAPELYRVTRRTMRVDVARRAGVRFVY